MWEGDQRVDLLEAYAPWATERCTRKCVVDGVCCCLEPAVAGGNVSLMPVSETHPLHLCAHFAAAVYMAEPVHQSGHSLDGFYSGLGLAVLGTVMNGDCGIDVACQMLQLPQTPAQIAALREETRLIN